MRFITTIICFILATVCFGAEPELPKNAVKALAEFDEAVAKARAELIRDLDKEKDRALKNGDLDAAIVIRAIVEEHLAVAEEAKKKAQAAEPLTLKEIQGDWDLKWVNNSGSVTFHVTISGKTARLNAYSSSRGRTDRVYSGTIDNAMAWTWEQSTGVFSYSVTKNAEDGSLVVLQHRKGELIDTAYMIRSSGD